MKTRLALLTLLLGGCGVKLPPTAPSAAPAAANFDCSIYDPDCAVTDPQYDPACDPARPNRPAVCDLWNQKYEKQRLAWRQEQERRKALKQKLIDEGRDEDSIKEEELAPPSDGWQHKVTQ